MRSLELFSGNGTVSSVFKSNNFETHSLDIDKIHNPTMVQDILTWDYTIFPPNFFDFIWASPDCTSWSIACHRHRTIKEGLVPKTETAIIGEKLIRKTLEIIDYFKPTVWIIENPRGRLRHFPPMKKLPHRTTVYYCNYGFPIQKPTDLWSNVELWDEKPQKRNTMKFGNYGKKGCKGGIRSARSAIPKALIERTYSHVYPDAVEA